MEKKIATDTPLYRHDAAYAREHGELPLYRESYQANIACKEAIEEAISENYGNNRLNSQAVFDAVSAEFSMERIQYVLANTVQYRAFSFGEKTFYHHVSTPLFLGSVLLCKPGTKKSRELAFQEK